MPYKFLEHTADVKFLAEAESIEEAFLFAAQALKETVCGDIAVLEQDERDLEIKGDDLESLLYNFLEEFLFLLDSDGFLFSKIYDLKIDDESFILRARVKGDKAENYKFTNDVKAITYSDMRVKFDMIDKKWVIQGVFDV